MLTPKKASAEKYLEPLITPLEKINPNVLTLLGSIPPLLFFVFVLFHWYLAAIIAFIGSLFDFFDGMVARKFNKVTVFGGFLDSTLDRVADFLFITAFSFAGIVRWEIAAPLLLFSFLTSYARGTSEKLAYANHDTKTNFAVGFIERTERLIGIVLALILYMLLPQVSLLGFNIAECILLILTLLSGYTVLQRIFYAKKHL